ncbi:MAG: response regulator transcription factor [Endozoicomonas sp.]
MSRILMADDHRIVAEGVARLLESEHEICDIVKDGAELLEKAAELKPDLIITDMSMPGINGMTVIRQLKEFLPGCPVICLSMHDEPEYVQGARNAGASGYVLKHQAGTELLSAVKEVLAGEMWFSYELNHIFDQKVALTGRQLEVLQLLAKGYSAKEVAKMLNISPRTVEFHKYKMIEQLDLEGSADLFKYALAQGLVV